MSGLRRLTAAVAMAGSAALAVTFGAGSATAMDYGDLVTSSIEREDNGDVTLSITNDTNATNAGDKWSGLSCTLMLLEPGAQGDAKSAVENARDFFATDYELDDLAWTIPAQALQAQFETLAATHGVPGTRVGEGVPGLGGSGFLIVYSHGESNSHTWTEAQADGAAGYVYLCMGKSNLSGAAGYGLVPGGDDETPGGNGSVGVGSIDFGGSLG